MGGVVSFKPENSGVNLNYVEVSPISGPVAGLFHRIRTGHCQDSYWVSKAIIDKSLSSLSIKGLEARVIINGDITKIPKEELDREYPNSAIFVYNPSTEEVALTPIPFYSGLEVEKFFVIRSPDYVSE